MDTHQSVLVTTAELKIAVSHTRKQLLDLLELAFGDHPKWSAARTCVLRVLGNSGLEGAIDALESRSCGNGGSHE